MIDCTKKLSKIWAIAVVMSVLLILALACYSTVHELHGQYDGLVVMKAVQSSYENNPSGFYCDVQGNDGDFQNRARFVRTNYLNQTNAGQLNLEYMSKQQLMNYFALHNWTEDQILNFPSLYMSRAYLTLVKQLPHYPAYVKKYHEHYSKYGTMQKVLGWLAGTYQRNLAERFAQLHRECEKKQKFHELQERQRQATECARLQEEKRHEHEAYRQRLTSLEQQLQSNDYSIDYHQERLAALHYVAENSERITRTIPVDEQTRFFAQEYDISSSALDGGVMNAYEYQLHTEFVEQLTAAAQLKSLYKNGQEYRVFLDALGHGVAFGIEANINKDATAATYWADYGWQVLDIAKAIGQGVALGVYNTAAFAANTIVHPIDTAKTILHGIGTITSFLARATGTIVRLQGGYHEQVDAEIAALLDQMSAVIDHCSKELAQIPLREKVKHTAAFATEIVMPAQVFKVAHTLCSRMRPLVTNTLKMIHDEQNVVEVAGAENLLMKASDGVQKIGSAVKEVVHDSRIVLESFHSQLMQSLEPEIAALRTMFDNKMKGFGEFANNYLKIDYKHLLGMELFFNHKGIPRLSGFHHDFMNTIEKSGVIKFTNKIVGKAGCYSADIVINGIVVPEKTFFPAHWSREKVISSIHEAYDNFIKTGAPAILEVNGKYRVEGFIEEGIKIRMHITKKGLITTAYPILS